MKLTNNKKMIRLTIARNTAEAAFAATKKALEAAKKTLKEAEMAHNQAKAVYLTVVDAENEINNLIYVEPGDDVEKDLNSFFNSSGEAQSHIKLNNYIALRKRVPMITFFLCLKIGSLKPPGVPMSVLCGQKAAHFGLPL